jgi:hypothetical protein
VSNVGVNELAKHLATNREGIARLVEGDVIKRCDDGTYNLDDCRVAYIRHLRDRPRGTGASTRLLEARERLTLLRVAEREHRLCGVEETNAAVTSFCGLTVAALEGLPGSIARARTDRELRAELQQWVTATRTRLADKAEKIADNLERTGQIGDPWAA